MLVFQMQLSLCCGASNCSSHCVLGTTLRPSKLTATKAKRLALRHSPTRAAARATAYLHVSRLPYQSAMADTLCYRPPLHHPRTQHKAARPTWAPSTGMTLPQQMLLAGVRMTLRAGGLFEESVFVPICPCVLIAN